MQPVKRMEIVTVALRLAEIASLLENVGLTGYTVIKDVTGHGNRGAQHGDELSDAFTNCYVLVACPPDKVDMAVDAIRPLLKQSGGICLVSDAQYVVH